MLNIPNSDDIKCIIYIYFLVPLFFYIVRLHGTVGNSTSSKEIPAYCKEWCYSHWTLCYEHARHCIKGLLLQKLHVLFFQTKNYHWARLMDTLHIITCMFQFHYHLPTKPQSCARAEVGASRHKTEEQKEASALPWLHSSSFMSKYSWSLASLVFIVSISALSLYLGRNHFYRQRFCYFSHQRSTIWITNNFIFFSWEKNNGIVLVE